MLSYLACQVIASLSTYKYKCWGISSVVERLLSMHEAMGSIPIFSILFMNFILLMGSHYDAFCIRRSQTTVHLKCTVWFSFTWLYIRDISECLSTDGMRSLCSHSEKT